MPTCKHHCLPMLWRCWLDDRKGIQSVKTLHQNPLAPVVDISGWGTDCTTLWQHHVPVSATRRATGLPRFTWKWPLKQYVCVVALVFKVSVHWLISFSFFSALTLLAGRQATHPICLQILLRQFPTVLILGYQPKLEQLCKTLTESKVTVTVVIALT